MASVQPTRFHRTHQRPRLGFRRGVAAIVLAAAAVGLSSCSSGGSDVSSTSQGSSTTAPVAEVGPNGTTSLAGDQLASQLDALPKAQLTDEERAGLLWMREEEKLARDVYQTLGDRYSTRVFSNIAAAEQTHTDAVLALLDRYGIDDPAAGQPAGSFTDPEIQRLYDSLVAQGNRSLVDALTVGATIEDLDIADLQARATTTPDIALVYDNLERGSRNHLRAFASQLDRVGATYTPTHISQAAYDEITSTGVERGR